MTIDQVIDAFEGQTALANILGVSVQAIGNMKTRGYVPSRHWPKLVRVASESPKEEARAITYDALAALVPADRVDAA